MIFIATAVAAVVEALRRASTQDWYAVVTIAVAALIGGVAGYTGVDGLSVTEGIVAGLSASGLITIASKIK